MHWKNLPALGSMTIPCLKESQIEPIACMHPVPMKKEQKKAKNRGKKNSLFSGKNFFKNLMMLPLFLFCFVFTRKTVHLAQITGILSSCLQQQVPEQSTAHKLQSTRWGPGGVAELYSIKWKNTTFTLATVYVGRDPGTEL